MNIHPSHKLSSFLTETLDKMQEHYYYDLYHFKIKPIEGTQKSKKSLLEKLDATYNLFYEHHGIRHRDNLNELKKILIDIAQKDHQVLFDNEIILRETYKIIALIKRHLEAMDLLADPRYYQRGTVSFEYSKKKLLSERDKYKYMIVKPRIILVHKGEMRVNWFLLEMFRRDKKKHLIKLYLYLISICDIEKFKLFYEETQHVKDVMKIIENYLIQQTTPDALVKSLAIVLYHEFKRFLKIKQDDAEVLTKRIIETLFNQTVNMHEFDRYVYLKSNIYYLPVFGATKTNPYSEENQAFFQKSIEHELTQQMDVDITGIDLKGMTEDFLKTSYIQFLQKYPRELFVKNSKYSHLPDPF